LSTRFSDQFADFERLKIIIAAITGFVIYYFLYSPIMEARGGTLGKKIIKLQTIDIRSRKEPSFSQTYKRSLFTIGPVIVLIIYWFIFPFFIDTRDPSFFLLFTFFLIFILPSIAMLWSPTKQCWYDKFSNITIIKNK
jgi:hypothetical protein